MRTFMLLSLLAVACSSPRLAESKTPSPPSTRLLASLAVERGMGPSPEYTISIYDDGRVAWNGVAEVAHLGLAEGQASPDELDELRAAFAAAGFMTLDDEYLAPPHKETGWVTIVYDDGKHEKKVRHRASGAREPASLHDIARLIERISGAEKWIGVEED
jgi:hypothetical protein